MKKTFPVIVLVILVLMFAGCTNLGANVYDGEYMSFEYPEGYNSSDNGKEFSELGNYEYVMLSCEDENQDIIVSAYLDATFEDVEKYVVQEIEKWKMTGMNYTRVTETIGGANCTIYKVEKMKNYHLMLLLQCPEFLIFQKEGMVFVL
ncbi:MAG: hypothetical protein QXH54_01000 [Methanothermobacter sp.]